MEPVLIARTGSFTPGPHGEKGIENMKIFKTIAAARCAVADRVVVTRGTKGKYGHYNEKYYYRMVEISGPSTHNPVKIAKSLYSAYQYNLERINNAEKIMHMFDSPPLMTRIYHRMFKK